jgi:hypothetical protein
MREASGHPSLFCVASYEKGQAFMREAAALGCEVRLLTVEKLADADWPKDILTEFFTMPSGLTAEQVVNTVTYLGRTRRIDRIVSLDEFDQEHCALLREHMRLPGQGQSSMRFFRDKLAMRTQAKACGVLVPEFTGVFNHGDIAAFLRDVPGPWLLKPRMTASAIGIKPLSDAEAIWPILDQLGDLQSHYVLERFIAGEVFHCEGITWGSKVVFRQPFQYGKPPIQTMHQGGIFTTRTLAPESDDGHGIAQIHDRLLAALGMQAGVTHSEFIKSATDGRFYFLETASRVGGAYIADVCELATGVNPWVEWARIEVALAEGREYAVPELRGKFAGAIISLARQQWPDTSAYDDPEVAKRLVKEHHAGLLVVSPEEERVKRLLGSYSERFLKDFNAVVAPPEELTN